MLRSLLVGWLLLILTVPASGEEEKWELIAFIGEKKDLFEFQPEEEEGYILMDLAFWGTYRVVKPLQGNVPTGDIEFAAYDHYGDPPFGRFRNVLLFVWRAGDAFEHDKYNFHAVFETRDGRWAVCGNPFARNKEGLHARRIAFKASSAVDVSDLKRNERYLYFPEKDFRHHGGRVSCRGKGAYVEDVMKGHDLKLIQTSRWY